MNRTKLVSRTLARTIFKAMRTFPVITITGPRQSGKTTLMKMLFSKSHSYVSLEDPDIRIRAKEDPNGFLSQYRLPLIIDEIQYVPDLLSYIKTRIDENRRPGQWLLTGSQHFALMQNITQSLTGRTAVLYLLPFSMSERLNKGMNTKDVPAFLRVIKSHHLLTQKRAKFNLSLSECILRGFYPEIALNKQVDRNLWCSSYITTYLERDIRNLANIGDLNQFERFVIACAIRTGQILNISDLARDIGISVPTARRWLSYLEAGNQVYLLYPYYKNIGKRIVKSPKLYFIDTALCTYLLGLNDATTLLRSPHFGSIFETMVIGDFLKRFFHSAEKPSMYYLKTRDGLEVDLVIEYAGRLHLFEIKAQMTITPKHAAHLLRLLNELRQTVSTGSIISATEGNMVVKNNIINYAWNKLLPL